MSEEKATVSGQPPEELEGYYDVYPARMRGDKTISDGAYRFYGLLVNLTRKSGYAWANNEWLCTQAGITERTLQAYLRQLEEGDYIVRDTDEDGRRRIWLFSAYCAAFCTPRKNLRGEGAENCGENNNKSDNTPYNPPEGDVPERRKTAAEQKADRDLWFDEIYKIYPVKDAEADARRQFHRIKPDHELAVVIYKAVRRQLGSEQWQRSLAEDGGRYIPTLCKWLRGERWKDPDRPSPKGSGKPEDPDEWEYELV